MKRYMKSVEIRFDEGIKVCAGNNPVEKEHLHEFIEIVYIFKGEVVHKINDKYFPIKAGDLIFINYEQIHAFSSDGEIEYINFLLNPEFMSKELVNKENIFELFRLMMADGFDSDETRIKPYMHFEGEERQEFEYIAGKMLQEFEHKAYGYNLFLKGYMQIIFSMMCRNLQCYDDTDSVIKSIMRYIDTDYFHNKLLMDYAKQKNYNPSYFSRKFKEMYGINFRTYVQQQRMEAAMNLLKNTDLSIGKIADRVGYQDVSYFHRQFKKYMHCTPKEARQNKQNVK